MSDYYRGIWMARRMEYRKAQDEAFARNKVLRMRLWGIGICALAIIVQAVIGEIWFSLETIPVVLIGLMFFGKEGD